MTIQELRHLINNTNLDPNMLVWIGVNDGEGTTPLMCTCIESTKYLDTDLYYDEHDEHDEHDEILYKQVFVLGNLRTNYIRKYAKDREIQKLEKINLEVSV